MASFWSHTLWRQTLTKSQTIGQGFRMHGIFTIQAGMGAGMSLTAMLEIRLAWVSLHQSSLVFRS